MNKNSTVERFKSTGNNAASDQEQPVTGVPKRVLESDDLFGSQTEIGILHQGSMYRLRLTRGGKLILNK